GFSSGAPEISSPRGRASPTVSEGPTRMGARTSSSLGASTPTSGADVARAASGGCGGSTRPAPGATASPARSGAGGGGGGNGGGGGTSTDGGAGTGACSTGCGEGSLGGAGACAWAAWATHSTARKSARMEVTV